MIKISVKVKDDKYLGMKKVFILGKIWDVP
jgi:hypothetical protein